MKHIRYVVAAAASVAVVVLGSTQTTGALWRNDAVTNGGIIRAGTLDIKVGASGAEVDAYELAALGGTNLGPDAFSQAPLTVRNAGNIAMRYRLQSAAATAPLASSMTVVASKVASVASCPADAPPNGTVATLYNGPLATAQGPASPAFRTLAAGASEVLCLRVALTASPPSRASTKVTFTFLAELG
ncbi:hypothetical protein [Rhodococcus sp. BP-241]|uniref:hypothetical protein n=1 Tax=Rhodococcus sp. BP-241 TaxID=2739441 RepID=UPI0027DFCE6A|nr:hypothetical protein [Rhodococcus sp. BP-241]